MNGSIETLDDRGLSEFEKFGVYNVTHDFQHGACVAFTLFEALANLKNCP